MINKINKCLIISIILSLLLAQCSINNAFKNLYNYNFGKAKEQFYRAAKLKKKKLFAYFGLTNMYLTYKNPFFNIDSAYKYLKKTEDLYLSTGLKNYPAYININDEKLNSIKKSIDSMFFYNRKRSWISYNNFIDSALTDIYIFKASQIRDSLAFEFVKNKDSSIYYKWYIDNFPKSSYIFQIKSLYEKKLFEEECKNGTIEEFENFIKKYPKSPYKRVAENMIYNKFKEKNTIKAYLLFINKYPDNVNINNAWRNIYKLYIDDFKPETYESFLKKFPQYPFKEEIKEAYILSKKKFFPVKKGKLWGFIDEDGLLQINYQYDWCDYFHNELAMVEKGNKYGFINKNGRFVIPIIYDDAEAFYNNYSVVKKNNKYGIINNKGDLIADTIYEYASNFYDGMAVVAIDGLYGYINTKGELVIPFQFDNAYDFNEDRAIIEKNGKFGYINKKGMFITKVNFDWCGQFVNGIAKVKKDNKFALINYKGNLLTQFIYDYIGEMHCNRILIIKKDKFGYLDKSGMEIIEAKYDAQPSTKLISNFSDYCYAIIDFNSYYNVIDSTSKKLFLNKYKEIRNPGYIISNNDSQIVFPVKKNDKWGYVDINGNVILPFIYFDAYPFKYELAKVKIKDSVDGYTLIDAKGNSVLNYKLSDIIEYGTKYLIGKNDSGWVFIYRKKKILSGYDKIELIDNDYLILYKKEKISYYSIKANKIIWKEDEF